MSYTSIDNEIKRLIGLRENAMKTYQEKKQIMKVFIIIGQDKSDTAKYCDEYYLALSKFLDQKIRFFGQYKNKQFDKDMLIKLQEYMDEWLNSGWNYLGQDKIETDSENAKDEFQFFKTIITAYEIKNKKTRRAGKKHKK